MQLEFLNENYIDYNHFFYGDPLPKINVVPVGAISGIFHHESELRKNVLESTSIDLESPADTLYTVIRDCKKQFIDWIKVILSHDNTDEKMSLYIERFVDNECGKKEAEIAEIIRYVVNQVKANRSRAMDIKLLLDKAVLNRP